MDLILCFWQVTVWRCSVYKLWFWLYLCIKPVLMLSNWFPYSETVQKRVENLGLWIHTIGLSWLFPTLIASCLVRWEYREGTRKGLQSRDQNLKGFLHHVEKLKNFRQGSNMIRFTFLKGLIECFKTCALRIIPCLAHFLCFCLANSFFNQEVGLLVVRTKMG